MISPTRLRCTPSGLVRTGVRAGVGALGASGAGGYLTLEMPRSGCGSGLRLERSEQALVDGVGAALAVHVGEQRLRAVVADEGRGLLAVRAEALADGVRGLVRAVGDGGAGGVAPAGALRGSGPGVVDGVASRAGEAAAQALEELVLRDREVDHEVDAREGCQSFGLRERAGEAVEDEALAAIVPGDALLEDAEREVVGDQVARVDEGLHLAAERAPRGHGGAEEVARADGRDAESCGEPRGLRALARALRAEEDEDHDRSWEGGDLSSAMQAVRGGVELVTGPFVRVLNADMMS